MRFDFDLTDKIDKDTYRRLVEEMVRDLRGDPCEFNRLVLADLMEEHGAEGAMERTTQYLRGIELAKEGEADRDAEPIWVERKEGASIPLASLDTRAAEAVLAATYWAWSRSRDEVGSSNLLMGISPLCPERRGEFKIDWLWADKTLSDTKRLKEGGGGLKVFVQRRLAPSDYQYLWVLVWKYRYLSTKIIGLTPALVREAEAVREHSPWGGWADVEEYPRPETTDKKIPVSSPGENERTPAEAVELMEAAAEELADVEAVEE